MPNTKPPVWLLDMERELPPNYNCWPLRPPISRCWWIPLKICRRVAKWQPKEFPVSSNLNPGGTNFITGTTRTPPKKMKAEACASLRAKVRRWEQWACRRPKCSSRGPTCAPSGPQPPSCAGWPAPQTRTRRGTPWSNPGLMEKKKMKELRWNGNDTDCNKG